MVRGSSFITRERLSRHLGGSDGELGCRVPERVMSDGEQKGVCPFVWKKKNDSREEGAGDKRYSSLQSKTEEGSARSQHSTIVSPGLCANIFLS